MPIASSTFIQDVILFLRNYVRTNVNDPLSRASGFVMTAYPKRSVQYPIITVKLTNTKSTKLGISSEVSLMDMDIEVRTWSRNAIESDTLTQNVINTLKNAQFGTGGTSESEIFNFKLNSVNPIVESDGINTIHSKVCNFTYKTIIT
jgi:hypothetical protein